MNLDAIKWSRVGAVGVCDIGVWPQTSGLGVKHPLGQPAQARLETCCVTSHPGSTQTDESTREGFGLELFGTFLKLFVPLVVFDGGTGFKTTSGAVEHSGLV